MKSSPASWNSTASGAEEERLSGAAESGRGKSTKKSTKGRKADTKKPDQPEFFES